SDRRIRGGGEQFHRRGGPARARSVVPGDHPRGVSDPEGGRMVVTGSGRTGSTVVGVESATGVGSPTAGSWTSVTAGSGGNGVADVASSSRSDQPRTSSRPTSTSRKLPTPRASTTDGGGPD